MNDQPPIDILSNLNELISFIVSSILGVFPSVVVVLVGILLLGIGLLFFLLTGTVPPIDFKL